MKGLYFIFVVFMGWMLGGCLQEQSMGFSETNDADIYVWADKDLTNIKVSVDKEIKKISYVFSNTNSFSSPTTSDQYTSKNNGRNIFDIKNENKHQYLKIVKIQENVATTTKAASDDDQLTVQLSINVTNDNSSSKSSTTKPATPRANGTKSTSNSTSANTTRTIQFEKKQETTSTKSSSSSDDYVCYKTTRDICEIEHVIFRETNAYRKRAKLKEFQPSVSVSYVARDWSNQQAKQGAISHNGFEEGKRLAVLNTLKSDNSLDANKIKWLANENVGMMGGYGSNSESLGKQFTNMWLNSHDHLANIQAPNTYLGVGVAKSGSGYYATQIFAY